MLAVWFALVLGATGAHGDASCAPARSSGEIPLACAPVLLQLRGDLTRPDAALVETAAREAKEIAAFPAGEGDLTLPDGYPINLLPNQTATGDSRPGAHHVDNRSWTDHNWEPVSRRGKVHNVTGLEDGKHFLSEELPVDKDNQLESYTLSKDYDKKGEIFAHWADENETGAGAGSETAAASQDAAPLAGSAALPETAARYENEKAAAPADLLPNQTATGDTRPGAHHVYTRSWAEPDWEPVNRRGEVHNVTGLEGGKHFLSENLPVDTDNQLENYTLSQDYNTKGGIFAHWAAENETGAGAAVNQ